jgi:putative alpha-1,2-mannosidase
MREMYRNTPDGICGNEDCGQMSAWYVMSAMGFYPVNPCGGEYELGLPLFPEVKLHLADGNTFTVKANNGNRNIKPSLNGKRVKGTTISHKDIIEGGVLEF